MKKSILFWAFLSSCTLPLNLNIPVTVKIWSWGLCSTIVWVALCSFIISYGLCLFLGGGCSRWREKNIQNKTPNKKCGNLCCRSFFSTWQISVQFAKTGKIAPICVTNLRGDPSFLIFIFSNPPFFFSSSK